MTIGEYIEFYQPEIHKLLFLLRGRILKNEGTKIIVTDDPKWSIEQLMRHDSFERRRGAIKQRGWGRG